MGSEAAKGSLLFVVHKHKATSLHYDFRLEIGDVMPSWSVPKGPTLDNTAKRLAMPTGDHPLDYRKFEGVIHEGYGAGTVIIWDEGTYDPEVEVAPGVRKRVVGRKGARSVAIKGLREGSLKFILFGQKLHGSFALVRTKGLQGKESWLLIKHKDEFVREGYDAKEFPLSAATGRSLEEVAAEGSSLDS